MTPLPSPSSNHFRVGTALWLALGVFVLTQAIWLNWGDGIPAGLGDGRLNQLILEHGYQSWRGHYDWRSPGQFYPVTHTLGWSDTHLGTLPIYAALRTLSFSPERAWQGWFVLGATLNLLLGLRLFRVLGLVSPLQGPIAFAAFAGAPTVWLAGTHPQLLPLFPGLWALSHLVRFAQTRHTPHLWLFAGGLAGQFAAGPYLAFFTGLVALGGTGMYLISSFRVVPERATPEKIGRLHHVGAAIGIGMGLINIWIYVQAVQSGATRPLSELIDLCPTWASWTTPSPALAFYASPGSAPGALHQDELALFAGVLPWLFALGAILVGWKYRAIPVARWAFVLGSTGFALVLLTVRWSHDFSIWLTLAQAIEPLRGFRAIGRVVVFSHALLAGASGLLWGFVLSRAASRSRIAVLGYVMAGLMIFEGLGTHQPHYLVSQSVARREAVEQAWWDAGNHRILAFAPGFTNQAEVNLNLDAWAAALARGRVTLNGYGGTAPPSHQGFLWTPSAANARELMQRLGLDETEVSVVTQFPADVAAALGFTYFPERALHSLDGFDLPPVAWSLFAPPERFDYEAGVFYQFTPNADVSFALPDGARRLTFLLGARPGSYSNGGDSDGFDFTWTITRHDGVPLATHAEILNPRDVPADRGWQRREIALPAGTSRILHFSFGPGPSGLNNWDWPLLGRLQVE